MPDQLELEVSPPVEATTPAATQETEVAQEPAVTGDTEVAEPDKDKNKTVVDEAKQKSEKRLSGIQRRIDELTRDKYTERQARENLEQQNKELLAILKGQKAPDGKTDDGRPKQDQYPDYADFVRADAVWLAEKAADAKIEKALSTQSEETRRQSFAQSEQQAVAQYNERAKEAAKSIPDYDEVMSDADVDVPMPVLAMIRRLDNGPTVAYHMAKNPALARQFFDQPAAMHGVLLGQLSATLKGTAKVSNAPPPGKPAQPKAGSSSEPPEDADAYMVWAAKHMR